MVKAVPGFISALRSPVEGRRLRGRLGFTAKPANGPGNMNITRKLFVRVVVRRLTLAALMFVVAGCIPGPPKHGVALVIEMETNRVGESLNIAEHLNRTQEVLRKRLYNLGHSFAVERESAERLLIKLPQLQSNELAEARRVILRGGLLEFRLVHPESAKLIENDIGEPGYQVLTLVRELGGTKHNEKLLVNRKPEQGLTGKYIKRAAVYRDSMTDQPEIDFELDKEGGAIFARVTKENIGQRLAIILDGELYSAPLIQGEIPHGRGRISGTFTAQEAVELANLLENPLEAPHKVVEERTF